MIIQVGVGDDDPIKGVTGPGNCQGSVDYIIEWLNINMEANAA
jgi:hypothetical protein